MGHESCVLINHDGYTQIADDPARFVRDLWHAVLKATREPVDFPMGVAVYQDHESTIRLLAIGGHQARVLAMDVTDGAGVHKDTTQLALLEQAADALGYKLVKKAAPRTTKKKTTKKKVAKKASSSQKATHGKTPAKGRK